MTLEEAKTLKTGDIVYYLGKDCMIASIEYYGSEHPYLGLVAESKQSESFKRKVSRSPVSYVVVEKR